MGIPNFELWAKHWQCTAHPAGFKLPTSWLLEDASVARSTWFWPFRILCMPCMPLPLYLPLFLYLSGYMPCMPICLSCVSLPLFPPCLKYTNALFWVEIWVHAPVCHHPHVCLSVCFPPVWVPSAAHCAHFLPTGTPCMPCFDSC